MSPQDLAHRLIDQLYTKPNGIKLRAYRGDFWQWTGKKYESCPGWDFKVFITAAIKALYKDRDDPPKITTQLVNNVINNMASEILIMEETETPCWVADHPDCSESNLLTMQNGLVSLDSLLEGRSARLYPHSPAWFSTIALPYDFDPTARCPKWEKFLEHIFEGDSERIKLLQEWFGYCLRPNTSAQQFLVLEGEGANGKSVVCELLTALLGEENVSHLPLEVFGDRFGLTATVNKLANITTDVGEMRSVAEGFLKQFVAGDKMSLDRKNQDYIHVRPTARLVLATNNRPKFTDRSDGVWRRMILIPFNVTILKQNQDRDLTKKLKEELPGILNWAVEGERRRLAQGRFTEPAVCVAAAAEYKLESNSAKLFLTESVEPKTGGKIKVDDLYLFYRDWSSLNGLKPVSRP